MDSSGKRYDSNSKPELSRGVVDFVVTKEYITHPLYPISYLFAIDVSYNSISSGLLALCILCIRRILSELPQDSPLKIGIVTYDTGVHFYNLIVKKKFLKNEKKLNTFFFLERTTNVGCCRYSRFICYFWRISSFCKIS